MKQIARMIWGVLAMAAVSLAAVSTASATTLEVGGAKQSGAVTIGASSLAADFKDTFGFELNQCESTFEGTTSVFTGTTVSGALSTLSFSSCVRPTTNVDTKGSLSIERIGSTANGTVRLIGAMWTLPSPFGTLTCKAASAPGTDIGTLTGVKSGKATIHVKANLDCGISAIMEANYTTTTAIGVGA